MPIKRGIGQHIKGIHMFWEIYFIALGIWAAGWLYLLVRNQRLYRYFQNLLDVVSACAQQDIEAGLPWKWRYDALNSMNYDRMLCRFWRSFDSFLPNRTFILPSYERWPVFYEDGQWFHWDETRGRPEGPFDTEAEAFGALKRYAEEIQS